MQKRIKHKLQSNKGFSLGELLLTILIICLAGVAMTGGFTAVHNSYKKITQQANAETLLSTTINKFNNYVRYGENVSASGTTITFDDPNSGFTTTITNGAGTGSTSANDTGLIISYTGGSHQLLADGAMNDGLVPEIKKISKNGETITYTIAIKNDKSKEITKQEVTTRLLNE